MTEQTTTPAAEYRVVRSGGGDYRVVRGAAREFVRNFGRRKADAERYAAQRNAA